MGTACVRIENLAEEVTQTGEIGDPIMNVSYEADYIEFENSKNQKKPDDVLNEHRGRGLKDRYINVYNK